MCICTCTCIYPDSFLEEKKAELLARLGAYVISPLLKDNITAMIALYFNEIPLHTDSIPLADRKVDLIYTAIGKPNSDTGRIDWRSVYPEQTKARLARSYYNRSEAVRHHKGHIYSFPIIRITKNGQTDWYLPMKTAAGSFKMYASVLKCSTKEGAIINIKFPKKGVLLWYATDMLSLERAQTIIEKHTAFYKKFPSFVTAPPIPLATHKTCLISRVVNYPKGDIRSLIKQNFFITSPKISLMFFKIAKILEAFHSAHYAIGDLKADNFVIDSDGNYLLCDLDSPGRAGELAHIGMGSVAPEQADHVCFIRFGSVTAFQYPVSARGDIFAFGSLISLFQKTYPGLVDRTILSVGTICRAERPDNRPSIDFILHCLAGFSSSD